MQILDFTFMYESNILMVTTSIPEVRFYTVDPKSNKINKKPTMTLKYP